MIPKYKIILKEDLTNDDRKIFAELLLKQQKVKGDLFLKADRCKEICIAYIDNTAVGIGGIKRKTVTDFDKEKANIKELEKDFDWELGYLYTEENYNGIGISNGIVKNLLERNTNENLMASTEIFQNPAMVRILEKNEFLRKGKSWKSEIHKNELGLFLRYKKTL